MNQLVRGVHRKTLARVLQNQSTKESKMKKNLMIKNDVVRVLGNQHGRIGYLVAWLLGVPASVLLVIFLIFGGGHR